MAAEHVNEVDFQIKLRGIASDLLKQIEQDEKEAESVTNRVRKNRELLHAVNKSLGLLTAQSTGFSKLSDTIRAVISGMEQDRFTAPDIEHLLTAKFPTVPVDKPRIRSTLSNMLKRGEITCTMRGNSHKPAEYSRSSGAGGTASVVPRGFDSVRKRAILSSISAPVNGEHSQ